MTGSFPYPLTFRPIPMARPWGGSRLSAMFGLPGGNGPWGEVWLVSAHPNGTSVVANGALAGLALPEAIAGDPVAYLGDALQDRFPLLVKFLDAGENLSVQLHPGDRYALAHEGDFGKTEAWVVLSAPLDGEVILGDRFGGPDDFREAVRTGRVEESLGRHPVRTGDILLVPAGTVHAVPAGAMLLEVQEASDVTYRIFDWGRTGRTLHVEKAAEVLFGTPEEAPRHRPAPRPTFAGEQLQGEVSCAYFALASVGLGPGRHRASAAGAPSLAVVLSGRGTLEFGGDAVPLAPGAAVLVPAGLSDWGIEADDALWVAAVTW